MGGGHEGRGDTGDMLLRTDEWDQVSDLSEWFVRPPSTTGEGTYLKWIVRDLATQRMYWFTNLHRTVRQDDVLSYAAEEIHRFWHTEPCQDPRCPVLVIFGEIEVEVDK